MEIKIEDHLTQDEMKQIASDAFSIHCAQKFRDDHERIFTNAAYEVVRRMVDEMFDGDAASMVAEKTKGCITKLSEHTVFGAKGIYDRDDTKGRKAINAAILKHNERIENRVAKLIEGISREDVLDAISQGDLSFTLARA